MIGFQVYIDESGDEGFCFNPDGSGSSRWFVLSAVVIRKEADLDTVRLADRVRSELGRRDRSPLHFRHLKHEHRLPYIAQIAAARLRTVSVLIHKPSITEPEKFTEKHVLYRYATRFLLERVSWYCRDHRRDAVQKARFVFSNRANMSYDDLRAYLELLKNRTGFFDVRIDWSVVDCSHVVADQHQRLMGLQIADAVASGMYGVERSRQGFIEPRYAQMLKPTVYAYRGKHIGYGMKIWPRVARQLISEYPELAWIGATYQ